MISVRVAFLYNLHRTSPSPSRVRGFSQHAWFPQVSFSEGGPGSNSTGSEVASMSSQLPDTPNSMVSSPIDAWVRVCLDRLNLLMLISSLQTAPNNQTGCNFLFIFWHCEDNHGIFTIDTQFPNPRWRETCNPSSWRCLFIFIYLFIYLIIIIAKREDANRAPLWHCRTSEWESNSISMLCATSKWKFFFLNRKINNPPTCPWGKQHRFSSCYFMISFMIQVLKHLQQGIPLFRHKLRGTFVWVQVAWENCFLFPKMCIPLT